MNQPTWLARMLRAHSSRSQPLTSRPEKHWLVIVAAILWFAGSPVLAQEDSRCLKCHDDPEMTGLVDGTEIPMYVTAEEIATSSHAGMACIECHSDLAGSKRRRHAEELEAVVCDDCHRRQAREHGGSLHGEAADRGDPMAPTCADCHGKHLSLIHI